jgi:nicotinate-nucleotide adenylyltransferase
VKRVAFYGGSYNPSHCGHQATVLYALETADVESVIVAPVYEHPYGKLLAPFNDRVAMCHNMIYPMIRHDAVRVSRIEETSWLRGGKGFTANTIKLLREEMKLAEDDVVVLVMGDDLRNDVDAWVGYPYLKAEKDAGRLEFFFVARATDLSSTKVREHLAKGLPYRRLVPKRVHEYLEKRPGLYTRPKDSL